MGTSLDENDGNQSEYRRGIHQMGELVVHRMLRPWLYNDIAYAFSPKFWEQRKLSGFLHDFSRKVIRDRKRSFGTRSAAQDSEEASEFNRKRREAMLDLLLSQEGKKEIDEDGIREEVDTFMFEGHDTTSMSICFTLMLLASHKDIQEKVIREVDEVLGDETEPSIGDLQELRYLEMCIKESLRLYPSVHFMSRITDEDLVTPSGYRIPKETEINFNVYAMHRDPEHFPDPENFDPDRFLPENCKNRHPFAFVPFSAGPRNCIGQKFAMLEMKAVISGLLRKFTLEAVDTQASVRIVAQIILKPENGIRVKFVPRK